MSWKTKIKYEGDCWMWTGCVTDGYGNYRGRLAHRVAYVELCGEPAGKLVNICGHRACVNPAHWSAPTEVDRFWVQVDKNGPRPAVLKTVCWLWVGGLDGKGYGAFRDRDGKQTIAHRKAWELTYGMYPEGHLLHHCDTPRCIRPEHMFIGDQAMNIADAVAKGRNAKNESHGAAKLSWEKIHEIRQRYVAGESQALLGKFYDVSQKSISNIVRHKTWAEN